MDAHYTSDTLHHFVGNANPTDHQRNFNILTKILSEGWVSHPPHENNHGKVGYNINWDRALITEELIVPTVTCFADIPENSLDIHIKKYSPFGVSFWRDHLFIIGARPVMYIPTGPLDWIMATNGRMILKDIEAVYRGFNQHVSSKHADSQKEWGRTSRGLGQIPPDEPSAINAMESIFEKYFLAFLKPFDMELGSAHPKNYYMEREWRKFGNLEFKPIDVCKVFVANGFKSELEKFLPDYAGKIEEIKTV